MDWDSRCGFEQFGRAEQSLRAFLAYATKKSADSAFARVNAWGIMLHASVRESAHLVAAAAIVSRSYFCRGLIGNRVEPRRRWRNPFCGQAWRDALDLVVALIHCYLGKSRGHTLNGMKSGRRCRRIILSVRIVCRHENTLSFEMLVLKNSLRPYYWALELDSFFVCRS
jgi:hypothetical protein